MAGLFSSCLNNRKFPQQNLEDKEVVDHFSYVQSVQNTLNHLLHFISFQSRRTRETPPTALTVELQSISSPSGSSTYICRARQYRSMHKPSPCFTCWLVPAWTITRTRSRCLMTGFLLDEFLHQLHQSPITALLFRLGDIFSMMKSPCGLCTPLTCLRPGSQRIRDGTALVLIGFDLTWCASHTMVIQQ